MALIAQVRETVLPVAIALVFVCLLFDTYGEHSFSTFNDVYLLTRIGLAVDIS